MILESCIFLAFANPADPTGRTIYPSGVGDNGDFIFSDYPASAAPLFRSADYIKLTKNFTLSPGVYQVKPSVDEKSLIFFEGCKTIFEMPLCEDILVPEYQSIPTIRLYKTKEQLIFVYRIENIQKKAVFSRLDY